MSEGYRPKAYVITVLVIDHDDWESNGPGTIANYLTRETGSAIKTEAFDIGAWGTEDNPDDHPLNYNSTDALAWLREHGKPIPGDTAQREYDKFQRELAAKREEDRMARDRALESLSPEIRKALGL